jgi:hypothetical protein
MVTYMSNTAALTEATTKSTEARSRFDAQPTWNKAKRDAAEDLEFWSNKVAFLAAWVGK